MLRHLIKIWDIIISNLAKVQVTYVQLLSLGEYKHLPMGVGMIYFVDLIYPFVDR